VCIRPFLLFYRVFSILDEETRGEERKSRKYKEEKRQQKRIKRKQQKSEVEI
jgi:hypothetical protein